MTRERPEADASDPPESDDDVLEDSHTLDVTRRDALIGAGGIGLGSVLATGTLGDAGEGAPDNCGTSPYTFQTHGAHHDTWEIVDKNYAFTGQSDLVYLGQSWTNWGNPTDEPGGAWKHTFTLSTTALGLRKEKETPGDDKPNLDSWVVPAIDPDDLSGLSTDSLNSGEKLWYDHARPSNAESSLKTIGVRSNLTVKSTDDTTSVSARRNPDQFKFFDPTLLLLEVLGHKSLDADYERYEEVKEQILDRLVAECEADGEGDCSRDALRNRAAAEAKPYRPRVRSKERAREWFEGPVSLTDGDRLELSDWRNDPGRLREEFEQQIEQLLEEKRDVEALFDIITTVVSLFAGSKLSATGQVANAAINTIIGGAISAYYESELNDLTEDQRYSTGFDKVEKISLNDGDATSRAGSKHFVTFDVYVPPETSGAFTVESGYDYRVRAQGTGGTNERKNVWKLDLPALPHPDDIDCKPREFAASVAQMPSLDPSATSVETNPIPGLRVVAGGDPVSIGDPVEFSGNDTVLGGADIDRWDWEVYTGSEDAGGKNVIDTNDGVDKSSRSAATFTTTIDAEDVNRAGTRDFTVALTVTDEAGNESRIERAVTVNNEAPVASIEAPTLDVYRGQPVPFEGFASDPNGDDIESYRWRFQGPFRKNAPEDIVKEWTREGKTVSTAFGISQPNQEFLEEDEYDSRYPDDDTKSGWKAILEVEDSKGVIGTETRWFATEPNQLPQPAIDVDNEPVPVDEPVTLDGRGSRDPDPSDVVESYTWTFEDGSVVTGSTVERTFEEAGDYDVTLAVRDTHGAKQEVTETISATSEPVRISVSTTEPAVDESVTFEAVTNAETSIQQATWYFGDEPLVAENAETGTSATHAYGTAGRYTVRLNAELGSGSTVVLDRTLEVGAAGAPVPRFEASSEESRKGATVSLDASATSDPDGTVEGYDWSLYYDGVERKQASGETASPGVSTSGEWWVELAVTGDDGTVAERGKPLSVEVNQPPDVDITVAESSSATVGPDTPVDLNVSVEDPDSDIQFFGWDAEGKDDFGPKRDEDSVSIAWDSAGEYDVTVTAVPASGPEGSDTKTITVTDEQPIASLTANKDTVEIDEQVRFDASGSKDPDGGEVSFEWPDDVSEEEIYEGGSEVRTQFGSAGEKTMTVDVTDDENNTTGASETVTVDGNDPPNVTVTADETTVETGTPVTFTADVSDPDSPQPVWGWSIDDYADEPTDNDVEQVTVTWNTAGEYTARVNASDREGSDVVTGKETVTVEDPNADPNVRVTADRTNVYRGQDVDLSATVSDPDSGNVSWGWSVDAAPGAGEVRNITRSWDAAGTFTAAVNASDREGGSGSDHVDINVTVGDGPTVNDINGDRAPPKNEQVSYSADVEVHSGLELTYTWGGDVSGNGSSIDKTWYSSGEKTVSVEVTDQFGRSDSDEITVAVGGYVQPDLEDEAAEAPVDGADVDGLDENGASVDGRTEASERSDAGADLRSLLDRLRR